MFRLNTYKKSWQIVCAINWTRLYQHPKSSETLRRNFWKTLKKLSKNQKNTITEKQANRGAHFLYSACHGAVRTPYPRQLRHCWKGSFQSRRHGGALVGLSPQTKHQSSLIETWNTINHWSSVNFYNIKLPRTNANPPYWKLSGDGSGSLSKQTTFIIQICRGGARGMPGGPLPPQNFAWPLSVPQKIFRVTSGRVGLFLKVLHRPLTAPLVAKLAPPVPSQMKMSGSVPANMCKFESSQK